MNIIQRLLSTVPRYMVGTLQIGHFSLIPGCHSNPRKQTIPTSTNHSGYVWYTKHRGRPTQVRTLHRHRQATRVGDMANPGVSFSITARRDSWQPTSRPPAHVRPTTRTHATIIPRQQYKHMQMAHVMTTTPSARTAALLQSQPQLATHPLNPSSSHPPAPGPSAEPSAPAPVPPRAAAAAATPWHSASAVPSQKSEYTTSRCRMTQ